MVEMPKDGWVVAVCTSPDKGDRKTPVEIAEMVADHGIDGDAHAGAWHRQISLLAASDIQEMRERGLDLAPGAFGENLVVDDVDLHRLGIGTTMAIGDSEIEITQIGKVCHSRCAIYFQTGDCIMPRDGIFARVTGSGPVRPGALVRVIGEVTRSTLQVGCVTVSDRAAAGEAGDTAGPAVADLVRQAWDAHLAWMGVVPDEEETIIDRLRNLAGRGLDLVITVGGTGCAHRDRTPEATLSVIDREIPGLAEAMRLTSAEITPHAWLQRGVCGILGSTVVVNLPGSRKAAVENLESILIPLQHAVDHVRGCANHPESDRERGTAKSLNPPAVRD